MMKVQRTITKEVKRHSMKRKPETVRVETFRVDSTDFHGDDKARIRAGRTFRVSAEYATRVMSTTVEVELSCNQDRKTIIAATKEALRIADSFVLEEMPFMEEFIKAEP